MASLQLQAGIGDTVFTANRCAENVLSKKWTKNLMCIICFFFADFPLLFYFCNEENFIYLR